MEPQTEAPESQVLEGELIDQEALLTMPQDDKVALINQYRKHVQGGGKLSQNVYDNSVRLIRALRAKAIQSNPRAKLAAKKAAETVPMDLDNF